MNQEFLEQYGLSQEAIDAILEAYAAGVQAECEAFLLERACSEALTSAGVRDEALARSLLNGEAFGFDGGVLTGVAEEIARLKQERPYLFCEEGPHFAPVSGTGEGAPDIVLSKEQLRRMSAREINDNWASVSAALER